MQKKLSAIYFLLIVIIAVACNTTPEQSTTNQTTDEMQDITIQLSWINEYSVAQLHNAIKNNHFADVGLLVNIEEVSFGENYVDPVTAVLDGDAQFGTAGASEILLAREAGKPVVAIMSTLHRSPAAIISLSDKNIIRPQDMIGKTIAVLFNGGNPDAAFNSLLVSQEIDPESINIIERTSFGIDPLIDDEVDAIRGWIINEGVMVEEAGLESNTILLSDYAIDTYESVIFTSEEMIQENPEMVQAFVDAVTAGMQDILDDPEASVENTIAFNEELDHDDQLRRLNAMIPLMNVPGLPLGGMQADVWEVTHQVLLDNGILESAMDWESAYTTQFIKTDEES